MNKQKYILIFSLANVQNFIAQARKTQDLNQGSRIISSIVKQVIDFMINELGKEKVTFITPAHANNHSIPNRFVVEIETTKEKAASLPEELFNYVMEIITSIAKAKFGDQALATVEWEINTIVAQIENFLDLHCILYPRTADYKTDYKNAEAHLGALKNARLFKQIDTAGETGRKCTLCGERNVVFYRKNINEKHKKEEEIKWSKLFLRKGSETAIILDTKDQKRHTLGDLNTGEGICSVCALKRFKFKDSFPSTAELAMLGLASADKKLDNAIEEYINIFGKNTFNWQFIYEENIRSKETMKKLGYFARPEKYKEIEAGHRKMTKKLNSYSQLSLGELPKYYAAICFDGDNMGDLFSGEVLDEEFSQQEGKLKEFQRALSGFLLDYALKLQERYQNSDHAHKTKMIYSGGDDFLGFINLQFLFEELEFLRNEFEQVVSAPIFDKYKDYLKSHIERISFSAGVVIAHYKTPLSIVIQETYKAENKAKTIDKYASKNAFCLCLLRRGGNQVSTLWHWNSEADTSKKILSLFQKLWQHLTNGELSPRFYGTLNQEFSLLLGNDKTRKSKEELKELEALLGFELNRILLRAKSPDFEAAPITKLAKDLLAYHREQIALKYDLNNLLRMFEIITFIERHTYSLEPTKIETT